MNIVMCWVEKSWVPFGFTSFENNNTAKIADSYPHESFSLKLHEYSCQIPVGSLADPCRIPVGSSGGSIWRIHLADPSGGSIWRIHLADPDKSYL